LNGVKGGKLGRDPTKKVERKGIGGGLARVGEGPSLFKRNRETQYMGKERIGNIGLGERRGEPGGSGRINRGFQARVTKVKMKECDSARRDDGTEILGEVGRFVKDGDGGEEILLFREGREERIMFLCPFPGERCGGGNCKESKKKRGGDGWKLREKRVK